jgi:hypothetical protein
VQSRNPETISWTQWLTEHHFAELFRLDRGEQPHFGTLRWQPGDQDRRAAWALYTELRTRIATQRLSYRSGDEDTALDSIYRLFDTSRSIIRKHERCTHIATLTVLVLNDRVRPFTAKWHRKKVDGRLSSVDERFVFRQELTDLRTVLERFASLLGVLAQDPEASRSPGIEQPRPLRREITDPILFGIPAGKLLDIDPSDINTAERDEVLSRRQAAGAPNRDSNEDAVGLALSGGGIRSATFSLGVLQTLARKGVLAQVDFLSTVSGGGYLGCFISSFLNSTPEEVNLNPQLNPNPQPFGREKSEESRAVRGLRNHSKYLTEGGLKTTATVIAFVIYGLITSLLLVLPPLLLGVLIAKALFAQMLIRPPALDLFITPLRYTLMSLGIAILAYPATQKLFPKVIQGYWAALCILIAAACILLIGAGAIPTAGLWLRDNGGAVRAMAIVALSALVLGSLGLRLGPASTGGRVVFTLFGLAGPLLMVLAFFLLVEILVVDLPDWDGYTLAFIILALYTGFFLDINFASPHLFYRNRLARTYLTQLRENGEVLPEDPQKLSAMNHNHKAPYHIINAALNIPASDEPNLRGRRTDFFWFSKHFCGSPITGFHPTTEWERVDSHLDLGTVMAISGAAAAPHMGTLTSRHYTFLLAMLNVRLGYWIRRPGRIAVPFSNLLNFARELTGYMTGKSRYLNLSDGGHIENLGIYELLRRRCKFIIAVDGEADPTRTFGGLLTLTQFAGIDLGIKIEPDLADLRMDATGNGRAHFGLSRIEYPGGPWGLLLYVKSSLTGNEPEFLKKYHAEHPDFPHQSTVNQLYTETQFEAYRALGEHIACDLFRPDLVGNWNNETRIHDWFRRLAENLLEDPY